MPKTPPKSNTYTHFLIPCPEHTSNCPSAAGVKWKQIWVKRGVILKKKMWGLGLDESGIEIEQASEHNERWLTYMYSLRPQMQKLQEFKPILLVGKLESPKVLV